MFGKKSPNIWMRIIKGSSFYCSNNKLSWEPLIKKKKKKIAGACNMTEYSPDEGTSHITSVELQRSASSISWSTTFGSASVLVSPSSSNCLEAIFLKILLIIFPLLVFGRPGAQCILSGAAKAPIWKVEQAWNLESIIMNLYICWTGVLVLIRFHVLIF